MTTFAKGATGKTKGGFDYEVLGHLSPDVLQVQVRGSTPRGLAFNMSFGYLHDGSLNLPAILREPFEQASGFNLDDWTLLAPEQAAA